MCIFRERPLPMPACLNRLRIPLSAILLAGAALQSISAAEQGGFKPSAPQGERYEATVPDTLDLADRAALALHGLTNAVDETHGDVQYFMTRFAANPPYLIHMDYGDIIC